MIERASRSLVFRVIAVNLHIFVNLVVFCYDKPSFDVHFATSRICDNRAKVIKRVNQLFLEYEIMLYVIVLLIYNHYFSVY